MSIFSLSAYTGICPSNGCGPEHAIDRIRRPARPRAVGCRHRHRLAAGFTLLEVLLAIFLLVVVMTTILASYNAVFTRADTIEAGSYDFEMAKTCLNRMVKDLMAIHVTLPPAYTPPDLDGPYDPYRVEGGLSGGIAGDLATLRFASRAHVALNQDPRQGVAEIAYYATESDDDRIVVRRADNLYPYETVEERSGDPVLCEKVKSLKFTYYDDEGEIQETWNSEEEAFGYATPLAIGLEITFSDDTPVPMQQTLVKLPLHRARRQ